MGLEELVSVITIIFLVISLVSKFLSARKLYKLDKEYELKKKLRAERIKNMDISFVKDKNYKIHDYNYSVVNRNIKDIERIILKAAEIDKIIGSKNDINSLSEIEEAISKVTSEIKKSNKLKRRNYLSKRVWIFLNSGLLNSIFNKIIYNEDQTSIDRNTVVGMIVSSKMKRDTTSYLYLSVALILHFSFHLIGFSDLNYWFVSFLFFMVSCLTLNQKALEFRIYRGFYGSNEYEAREIIGFINNYSDHDDFGDGGEKKLFQEPKKENNEMIGIYGGLLN